MTTNTTPNTIKRTTRAKKVANETPMTESTPTTKTTRQDSFFVDAFTVLAQNIEMTKDTFEKLQKEITETKKIWEKEQKDHDASISEQNQQEETLRKREQELYEYETRLTHKKAEDEFILQKTKWERELQENKEVIEQERKELDVLREQVSGFEIEKEKAIKDASLLLQKELTARFETENKLREQEIKGEKAILELKIATLTQEVTRQKIEIESLKQMLKDTTTQLKDVAVRVIDSSKPTIIKSSSDEEKSFKSTL